MIIDTNKYKTFYLYAPILNPYNIFTFNVKESKDKNLEGEEDFISQEIFGTIGTDDMKMVVFSNKNDNRHDPVEEPISCSIYKLSENYRKYKVFNLFTNKEEVTAYANNYLKEYNEHIVNAIADLDKEINRLKESKEIYQSMIKDKEINFSEKYE